MKANIEELITLNYELEGLLYLALHRGDDTPAQVWSMIGEKINALREGLPEMAETTEPIQPVVDVPETEPHAPAEEETPELNPLPIPEHHDLSTETPEEIQTVIKEEEAEAAEAAPEEEPDIAPGPIYEMEPEPVVTSEPVEAPEPVDVPEPVIITKPVVEEHKTASKPVENTAAPATDGTSVLRLDEKLARAYSRDLKKAFSLNDRFRFRRELFGNSDTMMTDTLNLVEAMPSYSEALDYFYTDLEWDRTMPEVIEFLKIIEQHFQGK